MSMRVVMVPLFGIEGEGAAVRAACTLARRFDGRVLGLFARTPAAESVPMIGEGISRDMIERLTRAAEEEMGRRRDQARERFTAACAGAGISIAPAGAPGGAETTAVFADVVGRRDEVLAARARLADLVVVSGTCAASGAEPRSAVEAVLLGSGRPLLVVPAEWSGSIAHSVAIAWNGRAEAARALALAMPLVEAAGAVHILTAATRRTASEAAEQLADYLSWHLTGSERHEVRLDGEVVGAALLRTAAGAGADLLVMGGYGRSRVSELVMGGVTRHVLNHANLPVLMAH
jgi:nucleotide-binding universal stress UspA family protein